MKPLGIKQFHQKTFSLLDLKGSKFAGVLGNVTRHFTCVIYGYSGNGKTEFCVQLAKELAKHGRVAWLSYEQRHGFDLQTATRRNNMEEQSGNFIPIDPLANIEKGVSLLEDLYNYLSKKASPEYIFIDSLDYTGFTFDDYKLLKEKFDGKKTFIFITHADKSGNLKKSVSRDVLFDGGMGIRVKDFIAEAEKNRYGGFEPHIVYEQKARERNPAFFTMRLKGQTALPLAGGADAVPAPKDGGNLPIPPH
ncbi:hypothetical protein SAMN05421827_105123 [Pedobacter terrae]|uniref:AAA+ ATPase domain-containing protein n=1 Tax=Pedobacter terrae TaxID=405671 RepID=A0A1G7T9K9_9SPHI|nr:hypothetical protein [Pedobacter terrae]SDG31968.1 hypothetical protein SAMN05421827_105123 [Pedobacter terrae]